MKQLLRKYDIIGNSNIDDNSNTGSNGGINRNHDIRVKKHCTRTFYYYRISMDCSHLISLRSVFTYNNIDNNDNQNNCNNTDNNNHNYSNDFNSNGKSNTIEDSNIAIMK